MDGQGSWERITGGVIAIAGPLVAAGAGAAYGVPAWAPAALAGAATTTVALRDWRQRRPWSERAFRLAVGAVAGGWTTWATWAGPWHLPQIIAGAAAAVVGLGVAPAFVGDDAPAAVAAATESAEREQQRLTPRAATWKTRIERIARLKPITITDEQDWPNRAGFTLHITFAPESGETWAKVDSVKHSLAGAAGLDEGCTISVAPGRRQDTAVVRVPTVYTFGEDLPLPDDYSPLSVWEDFPIGGNEDTTPALVNIRQSAGLLAGRRGGGKTNLLKVFIGQLLRCRDSLVWVVDLNGGGAAVPFMLPYVDGEVVNPPIDWIAATPEEAILMGDVAAAIAKDRKARYGALTARSGGDLLPVTADLPQITIVVDESAEVEGDPKARKAMDKLQEVLRIGRAEAVNVIFSALRATAETIPVNTRKQTTLKICGQVEDEAELEYVLPGAKVRSDDLVHPGTVFMRRAELGRSVRQVKVYRTLPDKIRSVVLATAAIRPVLDQPGQQIGGRVYAERMERLRPWLASLAGEPMDQAAPTGAGRAVPQTRPAGAVQTVPVVEAPEHQPTQAERDAERERARENLRRFAQRQEVKAMPKEKLDDVFSGMVADLRPAASPAEQDGQDTGWLDVLLDIVRESGPIGPTAMAEALKQRGISKTVKTLHDPWLPRLVDAGKLEKVTVNGKVKYRAP